MNFTLVIPDFVKKLDKMCPKCRALVTYAVKNEFSGEWREYCATCLQHQDNVRAQDKIREKSIEMHKRKIEKQKLRDIERSK